MSAQGAAPGAGDSGTAATSTGNTDIVPHDRRARIIRRALDRVGLRVEYRAFGPYVVPIISKAKAP